MSKFRRFLASGHSVSLHEEFISNFGESYIGDFENYYVGEFDTKFSEHYIENSVNLDSPDIITSNIDYENVWYDLQHDCRNDG